MILCNITNSMILVIIAVPPNDIKGNVSQVDGMRLRFTAIFTMAWIVISEITPTPTDLM